MIWNSAGVLLVLSVCGIVVASSERPVDCRGVAAKRGTQDREHSPPAIYVNAKSFRDFLRNVYSDIKLAREDEDDDDIDPLKKFYQKQGQEESIYKLFRESKRTKSESEGAVPVGHEYDNL